MTAGSSLPDRCYACEKLSYSRQHVYSSRLKLAIDTGCLLLGLILLLPLFPIVAILLKLDSPGAIFSYQERIGQGGRPFWTFKFRTMCVEAELFGAALAVRAGKGVTRVGRFSRQSKIDKLLKLLDVSAGSMALGGSRPEAPQFTEFYKPAHSNGILR